MLSGRFQRSNKIQSFIRLQVDSRPQQVRDTSGRFRAVSGIQPGPGSAGVADHRWPEADTPSARDAWVAHACGHIGDTLPEDQRDCALEEAQQRAQDAGDPETPDSAGVDFLTAETWNQMDAFGKRLILAGATTGKALSVCAQRGSG